MFWLRILQLALLAAAGALVTLSFAPWNLWPMALPALAWLALMQFRPKSPRHHFHNALLFALGMFGTGVSWIYVSINTYGESAAPLAGLLMAIFVGFLALVFALPWLAWRHFQARPAALPLAFAALWTLTEALRGWLLTGFPWLFIGHAHALSPPSGWLPIGGALAASFLVAWFGGAFAQLFRPGLRSSGGGHLLLGLVFVAGGLALDQVEWTTGLDQRSVSLVQPAIPLEDKWDANLRETNLQKLIDLAEPHWDVDLMVWPEAALPVNFSGDGELLNQLHDRAARQATALLTGRLAFSPFERSFYNSLIGLGDGGGEYSKRRLVPFGEYVPLEKQLRGLIAFFDMPMSNLSAGDEQQSLLRARALDIAPAICYEIAFAWQTARDARHAQLILTVSNDSWFGDSIGPWQHLQLAQVRAAENRKPVLRGTNSGITALIDARGQLTHVAPQFSATVLQGTTQPRVGNTPFAAWGHLPVLLLCLLCLAGSFNRRPLRERPSLQIPPG